MRPYYLHTVQMYQTDLQIYQWKQDEDITYPECVGRNFDTLTINSFYPKHQGKYTCVVNEHGKSVKFVPAE